MSDKQVARAVAMRVGDEEMMGLEIPANVIEEFGLQDGELVDVHISGNNLTFTKTGIISPNN